MVAVWLKKAMVVVFYAKAKLKHRIAGLVVKASTSRAKDLLFESRLRRDFSGSSHTSDLKLALEWLP